MLAPGQVPAPETLRALNERLAAWAAERPSVLVVPLAAFLEKVNARAAVELRGRTYGGEEEPLLQRDLLHPNVLGTAVLALFALDALVEARTDLAASAVRWDARAIAAELLPAEEPVGAGEGG